MLAIHLTPYKMDSDCVIECSGVQLEGLCFEQRQTHQLSRHLSYQVAISATHHNTVTCLVGYHCYYATFLSLLGNRS
jgi:hypothetical protein